MIQRSLNDARQVSLYHLEGRPTNEIRFFFERIPSSPMKYFPQHCHMGVDALFILGDQNAGLIAGERHTSQIGEGWPGGNKQVPAAEVYARLGIAR